MLGDRTPARAARSRAAALSTVLLGTIYCDRSHCPYLPAVTSRNRRNREHIVPCQFQFDFVEDSAVACLTTFIKVPTQGRRHKPGVGRELHMGSRRRGRVDAVNSAKRASDGGIDVC